MTPRKQIIVVNGKDRTDSIESYQFAGEKCNVVYSNSPRVYSYNRDNVRILKLVRTIDPKTVVFKAKGITISSIDGILDYGEFYRVVRTGRKELSFARNEVQLLKNCLADAKSGGLFEYFKETASAISLVTDNGINILSKQYDRIEAVEDSTVLSRYLNPDLPIEQRKRPEVLIYPFGLNQSQKIAVENAFLSQISIIQGPPGTGKTQTILNIIGKQLQLSPITILQHGMWKRSLRKRVWIFLPLFWGVYQIKHAFWMRKQHDIRICQFGA